MRATSRGHTGPASAGPAWRVIDQVVAAGGLEPGSPKVNEDRIGVNGPLAWVVDGATSLGPQKLTDAASDAAWLVDRIDEHLARLPGNDTRPLSAVLEDVVAAVRRGAAGWRSEPDVPPSAAVGLVRLRRDVVDYFVLSDVTVVFAGSQTVAFSDPRAERTQAETVAAFRARLLETGSLHQARRVLVPGVLHARRELMNRPGGFWTVSTAPDAIGQAITGSMPRSAARRVLLCSDGFARLIDVFGLHSSWDAFLASGSSLADALAQVRAAETGDGQCIEFARTSTSDDAAALLLAPEEV